MFVRRFPICAPLSFARRYIGDHNRIFDKLKESERVGPLDGGTSEYVCNQDSDDDRVEIINIDERILRNENIPWGEVKQTEEENKDDLHREGEFYKNMRYFKNVDVKSFIQETIDYYTFRQLGGDECTARGRLQMGTGEERFYEENKEKLIAESMKQYNERRMKLDGGNNPHFGGQSNQGKEAEEDYYHTQVTDPIVRQKENYLFDHEDDEGESNGDEGSSEADDSVELEKGVMPTIEQIVFILKHEKVKNIKVIDLDKCGRRDIGMFLILCTGETPRHNKRVGKLISRVFVDLEIPFISKVAYCYCNKFDDWIIAHCGPLKVHVVTKELRDVYDLENLFLYPHEHFDSGNFPAFFDYTPGIPPPYIVRSNSSLDAYPNDDLYRKFLTDA
ncbi:hypothetical protein PCYB_061480 [Plasmodium cynomolgi strain B]|uniref:Ribosomal silencing factor RsfS n=1 Tax=Plasmodium cynomolgi (strain B) TaxID=1120755 RepID=K6UCT6_PLACD|nr:hypothetical protein PCYB_061480 [Plasmodium cynomolgi strain B]GAB65416.1 hypothetical protein PCYB_061480 [Plasmodium cynomolgi strain B]